MRFPAALIITLALVGLGCSDDTESADRTAPTTKALPENAPTTEAPTITGPAPAVGSSGCGTPAALGRTDVRLTSGGLERTSIRHVPTGYDSSTPTPLVLDFHGYLEGAEIHAVATRMDLTADRHGFVVLTPQGTGTKPFWNATRVPGIVDDVAFVSDLLDRTEAELCIDTARIYSTGLSNGAFMSSLLACTMSDRIAAVAPVAGTLAIEPCDVERPVPVLSIHGTEDPIVPYGGFDRADGTADGENANGRPELPTDDVTAQVFGRLDLKPVPDAVKLWAERNGCDDERLTEALPPDVVRYIWDCPDGAAVEHYEITGAGHTWPGSTFLAGAANLVGTTSMTIDANEVMWAFFQGQAIRP